MGLDNIPKTYACKNRGTAVMVKVLDKNDEPVMNSFGEPQVRIDCGATQEAGACPWKNTLGDRDGRVLGMFGVPCWYRGKYGSYLLEQLGMEGYANDLFGEDEQGTITEDTLNSIYEALKERFTNDNGIRAKEIMIDGENCADDVWYLADWCRFTAEYSDGAIAWY